MTVFLFLPRFVDPIRAGTKLQTIRRTARVVSGQVMALRMWTGKPYRSPQENIVPPVVFANVHTIWIAVDWFDNRIDVAIDGEPVEDVPAFVRADGFRCVSDMVGYYRDHKVDAFHGSLIRWKEVLP